MNMAVDFDTRLDSALNRIAQGTPSQDAASDLPEAADLLAAAERLKELAPVPVPDLSRGKLRFLQEAERMHSPRPARTWGGVRARLVFGVALAAALVLIVANVLFVQLPNNITRDPTLTATPTRLSFLPDPIPGVVHVVPSSASSLSPLPAPVPVPDRTAGLPLNLISSSQSFSESCQCRS